MISIEQRGSIYAILSGFLYGFVGYFGVSIIHSSISITNMLFWRFMIASLVIGVILFLTKPKQFPHKDMCIAFVNGAIFYGLSTWLYFLACPYIGSGLAMVILFTFPAMVMLLNHFIFKKEIPTIYYFALAIIIIGMCFFIDKNEIRVDIVGIVLSIFSALSYAGYIVSSKKITSLTPMLSTLMICSGCATTFFFFSCLNHTLTIPTTRIIWLDLCGISIVSTAAPVLLLMYSLNYIHSEKAAILSVLEPIFVVILGVTLLGEPMKLQYIMGIIIVLTGALLTLVSQRTHLNLKNIKNRQLWGAVAIKKD
jgi:drug/metabolite transporter (DMT)-like permease